MPQQFHRVFISVPDASHGTRVYLDEQEIHGVRYVGFKHRVDHVALVTLEIIPQSLELEGEAAINQITGNLSELRVDDSLVADVTDLADETRRYIQLTADLGYSDSDAQFIVERERQSRNEQRSRERSNPEQLPTFGEEGSRLRPTSRRVPRNQRNRNNDSDQSATVARTSRLD